MPDLVCPECGGRLIYDPVTGYYSCTSCGLSATRAQLSVLRDRKREQASAERRSRREYLEWWTSSSKGK
ncbi:MAG: TFIIB-type zinc ribbon-containing protein [Nitrososphaeria archaeon]